MARLIDADALKEKRTMVTKSYKPNAIMERAAILLEDVETAPTIDAEPVKHGKWIWEDCVYKCSECSHKAYGNILECMDGTYKYCPYCGARMEIEDENAD